MADIPTEVLEKMPEFTTHDRDLVVILWAHGHKLVPQGSTRKFKTVYFTFKRTPELLELARKYETGEPIEVSLWAMWRGYYLFQNHMHDLSRDRRIIVSMMSVGHKPSERASDHSRTLRYRFPDSADADIWKFLSNDDFVIDARCFWKSQERFSDDARSNR